MSLLLAEHVGRNKRRRPGISLPLFSPTTEQTADTTLTDTQHSKRGPPLTPEGEGKGGQMVSSPLPDYDSYPVPL